MNGESASHARRHGVVIDRSGGKAWLRATGVMVLDADVWRLTVIADRWDRYVPRGVEVVAIGDFSESGIRAAVHRIAEESKIDAISTGSEFFLLTVAELRRELGIAGKSPSYTRRVRDKWAMKQRARQLGIAHARGTLMTNLPEWPQDVGACGGYVVKPRAESGSRGVAVIDSWAEVLDTVRQTADADRYIVEEFESSAVLHVDGLSVGGDVEMQVSRYVRPCYVTGGPVPLSSATVDDPELVSRVREFMSRLLEGWPIEDDVFHCEVFDAPGGISLCEIAGRPGGAGVVDVFSATRGINLRHAKTLLDFGMDPGVLRGPVVAPHGGWTVIYAPGPTYVGVDDDALVGHHTREVIGPLDPRVEGIAGVGVATYSFASTTEPEVLARIAQYERDVQIRESGHP